MNKKRKKKEFSTKKFIGIVFLCLTIWWLLLIGVSELIVLDDTDVLYNVLTVLRILVPVLTILFIIPIVLIAEVKPDKRSKW